MSDKLDTIFKMQEELNSVIGKTPTPDQLFDYITAMEQEIAELKDCANWKWWSAQYKNYPKHGLIDEQNAVVELIDILHFYICMLQALGITPQQMFDVYCQKHAINLKRQKDKYDHLNKTEEDNKTIEVK